MNPYRSTVPEPLAPPPEERRAFRLFTLVVVLFGAYVSLGNVIFYMQILEVLANVARIDLTYYFFYGLVIGGITVTGAILIGLTYFYTFRREIFRRAALGLLSLFFGLCAGAFFFYDTLQTAWISIMRMAMGGGRIL